MCKEERSKLKIKFFFHNEKKEGKTFFFFSQIKLRIRMFNVWIDLCNFRLRCLYWKEKNSPFCWNKNWPTNSQWNNFFLVLFWPQRKNPIPMDRFWVTFLLKFKQKPEKNEMEKNFKCSKRIFYIVEPAHLIFVSNKEINDMPMVYTIKLFIFIFIFFAHSSSVYNHQ